MPGSDIIMIRDQQHIFIQVSKKCFCNMANCLKWHLACVHNNCMIKILHYIIVVACQRCIRRVFKSGLFSGHASTINIQRTATTDYHKNGEEILTRDLTGKDCLNYFIMSQKQRLPKGLALIGFSSLHIHSLFLKRRFFKFQLQNSPKTFF